MQSCADCGVFLSTVRGSEATRSVSFHVADKTHPVLQYLMPAILANQEAAVGGFSLGPAWGTLALKGKINPQSNS